MNNQEKQNMDYVTKTLLDVYEVAARSGEDDPEEFMEMMGRVCKLKQDAQFAQSALTAAGRCDNLADFDNAYQQTLDGRKKADITKSKEYKEFEDAVKAIKQNLVAAPALSNRSRDEPEELVMDSAAQSVIDPITKLRMTDPVKNKICGHRYQKSTILGMIKANKRQRCIFSGCANKQYVQPDHLVEDREFKTHLTAMLDEEEE